MADDYIPPLSPNIVFTFRDVPYTPPLSPGIVFLLGADEGGGGGTDGPLQSNYMMLLTM